MDFNKYYQNELDYLRDMGEEFAQRYPKLAPYLTQRGTDPDVERLLEGFAFIAGRIRQKLDDQLPELAEGIFTLLWPHFLRPIPCMSLLEFHPISSVITEKKTVASGMEVESEYVENTRCRFRTCFDVDIFPIEITQVSHKSTGSGSQIRLSFKTLNDISLGNIDCQQLRIYLHGNPYVSSMLSLWLLHHVEEITLESDDDGYQTRKLHLGKEAIEAGGFSETEMLIPYPKNVFSGYRYLQEYYCMPQKFNFVILKKLARLKELANAKSFSVTFNFSHSFEGLLRPERSHFKLYCTPIINLFERDADPLRLTLQKMDYLVKPIGNDPQHYEIFTIDHVEGRIQGTGEIREYNPFLSFTNSLTLGREAQTDGQFFQLHRKPGVVGRGIDTYISFTPQAVWLEDKEVISLKLTCSNRYLPEKLKEGDICRPTGSTPEYVKFANLLPVSPSLPPPLQQNDLHWLLISSMSLNYETLTDIQALKTMLSIYNFPAMYNRQLARANDLRLSGIQAIETAPVTLMFKGVLARGLRTHIKINSAKFSSEGEMYNFLTVLERFFSLFISINSFHELWATDVEKGEVYRWKPRTGNQLHM